MDDHVKFGDSRSNCSRNIRGADFVSNEHDRRLSHKVDTLVVVLSDFNKFDNDTHGRATF